VPLREIETSLSNIEVGERLPEDALKMMGR
jgi:hypothetical protein